MPSYFVGEGEEERHYEVSSQEDGLLHVVFPSGEERVVDVYQPEPGTWHMLLGARSLDADVRTSIQDHVWSVHVGMELHHVEVLNARQKRMRAASAGSARGGSPELKSPMAGKVVALHVAPGDVVAQGDPVIIVEAMKMENDLKAHLSGVIERIEVAAGDAVEVGDVLLVITFQEHEASGA